ncbi:hypothetical protein KR093_004176, partial [Drosophila rubida]
MKFSVALCLLLAASCSASPTSEDNYLNHFLGLQQKAMRTLISAHAISNDPDVINACFTDYLNDQQSTLTTYNKAYSGCISTSQASREEVTADSQAQRSDLQDRSTGMCGHLSSCDDVHDGLEFFECYRDASINSYKIMFTLNSDANTRYNTIKASYDTIRVTETDCVDTARLSYAQNLEKCDSDFNVCVGLDPEPTDAPVTAGPTDAPVTAGPTDAPVTAGPTDAPVTAGPTDAPVTAGPTDAPVTAGPTDAPVTAGPTDAPVTAGPTDAPVTAGPTDAPVTAGPTDAPVTAGPTDAPVTAGPTDAPVTAGPTDAPVTAGPTDAPVTAGPTDAPVTAGPTDAPETVETTDAPVPEPTTEPAPEE